MREGRDFLPHDVTPGLDDQKRPVAGHGIVNEAFSRRHFGGESPVGRRVTLGAGANGIPLEIVGLVANAAYLTVRETLRPTVYVPIAARDSGTFFVRTAADPSAASEALRKRIPEIRPDLRVRRTQPLEQLVTRQLVRERALAMLSLFFAAVALLLAGIGLSGVVNGAVLRQRREIGIRLALGAPRPQIIRRVVARIGVAALVGCGVGLAIGIALGSLAADLLFAVRSTDAWTMLIPTLVLALAATLAALPPVVRAVRTNLVGALKEEAPS
jgi:hypothetical protein